MRLHFLGSGSKDTRGELSEGGFLLKDSDTVLLVDPGPGAAFGLKRLKLAKVDGVVITSEERGHDANLIAGAEPVIKAGKISVEHLGFAVRFRLPDGVIHYITKKVPSKEIKNLKGEVLIILARGQEKELLSVLKPKLAVLTGFDRHFLKNNPLYFARELQSGTGVQTIAAKDDLSVDLFSYGALSEQKGLSKFEKNKN